MNSRTEGRRESLEYQDTLIAWYAAMCNAAQRMPAAERAELEAWERDNLDGHSVATSDWPGWERHVGPRPRAGGEA